MTVCLFLISLSMQVPGNRPSDRTVSMLGVVRRVHVRGSHSYNGTVQGGCTFTEHATTVQIVAVVPLWHGPIKNRKGMQHRQ